MTVVTGKIFYVKLIVIFSAIIFGGFVFLQFGGGYETVSASAFGPSPTHTDAPGESNCTECHSSFAVNSGAGSVTVSGIPAYYSPNQQIPITVTTSQEDAVIYGFQMTAIDGQGKMIGTYTLPAQSPAQTQVLTGFVNNNQRRYIEHTVDGITPTVFGSKSWTFTWNAPPQRVGKIRFFAAGNAANSDGSTSGDYIYTTDRYTFSGTAVSNFDADGKSDIAVFRPSNGTWYVLNSATGTFQGAAFGQAGDKIVPGDYDGDGKTDFAVYRPSNGSWYIQKSSGGTASAQFGASTDIPVAGDYDGDHKTDIAVFRPSNGTWYIIQSSNSAFIYQAYGQNGDIPVAGDYDADGKTDVAVYRPAAGAWFINRTQSGSIGYTFGASSDKPVPADYDGDGKTDVAVYRPSNGGWYLLRSRDGITGIAFGAAADKPAPADFDGDGKADIAVYRPSEGAWYILRSSDGSFYATLFGASEDVPVPNGYFAQ